MAKGIKITIENKLVTEKRDMSVYHHSTKSAHMISYNSSVTLPLRSILENDYLHISIVAGPGNLKNKSIVNLPVWLDFEFLSEGNITVSHSGDRTLLKIFPGLSMWQLKMTLSTSSFANRSPDRVIIGDDRLEYR
jgi:hypothetical protein